MTTDRYESGRKKCEELEKNKYKTEIMNQNGKWKKKNNTIMAASKG